MVKDIRSHRLVHRIPTYIDRPNPTYLAPPQGISQASTTATIALLVRSDTKATSRTRCKGSLPRSNCAFLIARGHDNTLCSGCRDTFPHRMSTDDSEEKQKEIRKQVDVLLDLGVIKESQATEWSQVQLVPKPTPESQPQK